LLVKNHFEKKWFFTRKVHHETQGGGFSRDLEYVSDIIERARKVEGLLQKEYTCNPFSDPGKLGINGNAAPALLR
jgi:hypothetical protein